MSIPIIFFGTSDFAVQILEELFKCSDLNVTLVVTKKDASQKRSKIPVPSPIKKTALQFNTPVITPTNLSKNKSFFYSHGPFEIGVLVAYGKLLPKWLLQLPKKGIINMHPSLLPELRGPSPLQTALLQDKKETGITYMRMDEEMDHGPVILQKKVTIDKKDTYASLTKKISLYAVKTLPDVLRKYIQGELREREQDHSKATYSHTLTKKDGKLDWNNSAEEIVNRIRAFNPWPGTYGIWKGKKLKIFEANILVSSRVRKPGHVMNEKGMLTVGTSNGIIEILCVQLEGKKPLPTTRFLHGHPEIAGSTLS